ncbi:MAG: DUF692 domain-containing protein [Myxococcales bacterium]|nr:DUF692 domain-containing protein [Myxococcales bacterium]
MTPFGYGLRVPHYAELLRNGAGVPYVEALTENFLERGGRPAAVLERVRRDARVLLHGVGLSIGGVDPLRSDYLRKLRALREAVLPEVVSDHLCFGSFGGRHGHDLWPLPFTEEALAHVVRRVVEVQDQLGSRIALENVSSYVTYASSEMTEWEFLSEVSERADCFLLLDVNNVHVSATNHGFDARAFVRGLPQRRVAQFHVAGHSVREGYLFDDHGSDVPDVVWRLYREAVERFGAVPCIVERDENVPDLAVLVQESERAGAIAASALSAAASALEATACAIAFGAAS